MIHITDKTNCTGCEACVNICPANAISMQPDKEGFSYPIVNHKLCINCALCEKCCPTLTERNIQETTTAYAVQNKNMQVRMESSSGGAFTAIAQYILNCNGVVFGAIYDKNFEVVHSSVEKETELYKFRGSKYVQSRIDDTYKTIKKYLSCGRMVCFSGTPCQVEGLKNFLGKPYDNLITVDIVCHGVPSPKLYRKYIDFQQNKFGKLKRVSFRDKRYGYAGSTMALYFENGRVISNSRELQFFKDTFFLNLSTRPSCYACHFKTVERVSDFTIFDCWNIRIWNKKMDDNKGTTLILLHNKRSREIFEKISSTFDYCSVDVNKAISLDGDMATASIPMNPARETFFEDMDKLSIPDLMRKYIPLTFRRRIVFLAKPILSKFIPFIKRLSPR